MIRVLLVCFSLSATPALSSVVDGVAAVVDGRVITRSEVEELAATRSRLDARSAGAVREALDLLIEKALVEKEAARYGIDTSEEEVDRGIADVRSRNSMDAEAFEGALRAQGIAYGAYRSEIRREILKAKVAGPVLRARLDGAREDELRAYYLKNVSAFREAEEVRLGHLELSADRGAAEAARTKIAAGADPRESARTVPGAGGYADLGWMTPESLSEAVREAIQTVAAGGVTDVVELGGKCHLFLVTEKKKGRVPPYEEILELVRQRYFEEKEQELYGAWLDSLKQNARIEEKM
jgi:parvulin-like peptidyl-prolyl isomerase